MSYKVAVRKNSTGEIRFYPWDYDTGIKELSDIDGQIFYWTDGNMGCGCNLAQLFDGDTDECSDDIYTNLSIEYEDGRRIDLQPTNGLPTNYAKCPLCNGFLYRIGGNFYCESCHEPFWEKDIVFAW